MIQRLYNFLSRTSTSLEVIDVRMSWWMVITCCFQFAGGGEGKSRWWQWVGSSEHMSRHVLQNKEFKRCPSNMAWRIMMTVWSNICRLSKWLFDLGPGHLQAVWVSLSLTPPDRSEYTYTEAPGSKRRWADPRRKFLTSHIGSEGFEDYESNSSCFCRL